MSTDVAVREQQMTVLDNEQLRYIANTEFVPPGLRGNLPAILACVATGRALGIADMTALRSIHIIDGKATFSAELMVQLVRRKGHSITGEVTAGSATVTGTRADNGDTMTSTWTLEMADRAGLLGKSNWKKYPEAMLWARAASQLCRMLFADCFAGQTYTPEELEDTDSVGAPQPQTDGDPAAHTPFSYGWEEDGSPAPSEQSDPTPSEGAPAPANNPQKKKLDVLVKGTGTEEAPRVPPPIQRVYATVGLMRAMSADSLILVLEARDDDGVVHWSPLRDSLSKAEANQLIDRLENFEKSQAAARTRSGRSADDAGLSATRKDSE